MSTFLLRFEAIESRIASYSCPRGASGRVHSLRLRRCFTNSTFRKQEALRPEIQIPFLPDPPKQTLFYQSPDYRKGSIGRAADENPSGEQEQDQGDGPAEVPERKYILRIRNRKGPTPACYRYFLRKRLTALELGDVPPGVQDLDAIPNDPTKEEKRLYAALRRGDPQMVLQALIEHTSVDGFVSTTALLESIPPTMFSEILRCLDPKHFIARHLALHKEVSPAQTHVLRLPGVIDEDGFYKFCTHFLDQAIGILNRRQSQNFPLALSDYKYILKCARATGNSRVATEIWSRLRKTKSDDLTGQIELVPDAECYNDYLATKCWLDSPNAYQRYRLRFIPDNTFPRTWEAVPYSLKGHTLGPRRGVKAQASQLFQQMVKSGVAGNEETFCLMITAMAREGDMDSTASILKRVWGIDVEGLMTADETAVPSAKSYPEDSPFYPSNILLYTLAHAYGTNNNIPLALRVVDYVSSQYSIPIPIEVWNELFEWTFVLSLTPSVMKRDGVPLQHGKEAGRLPPEAVSSLWDTMISEPYNAKPTLEMYNRFMSNLLYRKRFGEMQARMEEGRALHKEAVREFTRDLAVLHATSGTIPTWLRYKRTRDLAFARLRLARNRLYIRRWVRLLIHHGTRSLSDTEWATHELPRQMQNWKLFLPRVVEYPIHSGYVRIYSQSRALNRAKQQKFAERMVDRVKRLKERRCKMLPNRNLEMGASELANRKRKLGLGIVQES